MRFYEYLIRWRLRGRGSAVRGASLTDQSPLIQSDVTIAKNYLSEKEVDSLNLLTTAFLDMAEDRANRHILMKMADWKALLERYLQISDRDILPDAGSVTHEEAEAKALGEYEKFWRIQDQTFLSDFDKFIEEIK